MLYVTSWRKTSVQNKLLASESLAQEVIFRSNESCKDKLRPHFAVRQNIVLFRHLHTMRRPQSDCRRTTRRDSEGRGGLALLACQKTSSTVTHFTGRESVGIWHTSPVTNRRLAYSLNCSWHDDVSQRQTVPHQQARLLYRNWNSCWSYPGHGIRRLLLSNVRRDELSIRYELQNHQQFDNFPEVTSMRVQTSHVVGYCVAL